MKKIFLILLLPLLARAETGLDDMIRWRGSFHTEGGEVSLFPSNLCATGFRGTYLHANPYQLSSLNWDYMAAQYGWGRWGLFGEIRTYALSELYHDNRLTFGAGYLVGRYIGLAASAGWTRELYRNAIHPGLKDIYDGLDLNLGASVDYGQLSASAWIERLNLIKPYEFDGIGRPAFRLSGSYLFNEGVVMSAGYERNSHKVSRLSLGQRVRFLKAAELRLGLMSNPNILHWGLDLSWKKITLGFTYFAMSKLSDTTVLGLSYGVK